MFYLLGILITIGILLYVFWRPIVGYSRCVFQPFGHPPCFWPRAGRTCHSSQLGTTQGWCQDPSPSRHGLRAGDARGPWFGTCDEWVFSDKACPPTGCTGQYPEGLTRQPKIPDTARWGWCADDGRAARGTACGPLIGSCKRWVWLAKQCPSQRCCRKQRQAAALGQHTTCKCQSLAVKAGQTTTQFGSMVAQMPSWTQLKSRLISTSASSPPAPKN
jgi:hypothetical protein